MSFLGALRSIGKGLLTGARVVSGITSNPLTSMVVAGAFPQAAGVMTLISRISSGAVNIEAAHAAAGKEKSGPEKFAFVETDFVESLNIYKAVAALRGKAVVYDAVALQETINHQVAAMNSGQKLLASIKEIDAAE